jgi:hypothetical protein
MRRNFSKFATNRSTCLPGTRSTHVPEKHGIRCIWLPVTRWTQTVPDLRLSRHHSSAQAPHSPAALRAARRAQRSLIGHHPRRPSPAAPAPRSLSVLRHAGSYSRPLWAGFTPHASMVPCPTRRPRRGRSGSGCSRRLPSGCTAQRRTSITVGEAESCEHTDQASQGFDSTPASKYLNSSYPGASVTI